MSRADSEVGRPLAGLVEDDAFRIWRAQRVVVKKDELVATVISWRYE